MYGKTYKLHNSTALAPAEALLSSSLAFDRLYDNILFYFAVFLLKGIKEKAIAQ